jgi:predicted nucleotidyltransferase
MEEIVSNKILKVIGELEKNPSHLRELSRKTSFSHTHIGKIISKLYALGALEKKEIGKSLVYEIKKNLISLNLLISYKKLELLEILEKDKKLKIILEEIFSSLEDSLQEINCIILFGSYSKGLQKNSSDLDLFFITELDSKILKNKIKKIENSRGIKINIKILNIKNFKKELNNPLTKEILRGIPLINSEIFYNLKWKK